MTKKFIRLYTGSDNESHLEDMKIPFTDIKGKTQQSKPIEAKSIVFRKTEGIDHSPRHNAPHRQFIIMLDGELEIEVGDGTRRKLGPGDVLLAEDTTGRGHFAHINNRNAVVVPLD